MSARTVVQRCAWGLDEEQGFVSSCGYVFLVKATTRCPRCGEVIVQVTEPMVVERGGAA